MKNINDLIQENKNAQDNLAQLSDNLSFNSNQKPQQNLSASGAQTTPDHQEKEVDSSLALANKMKELRQKQIEEELRLQAQNLNWGYVNLKGIPIPTDVLEVINLEDVRSKKVICFYFAPHKVARLAFLNQEAAIIEQLKQEMANQLGVDIEVFLTSEVSFASALKQYEAIPQIREVSHGVIITESDLTKFSGQLKNLADIMALIKTASTTELVAVIVATGLKTEASDIHIEAEADGIKLRYRVDGVLNTAGELDKSIWQQLISRLKLLSGLKLNIFDKPQDGRFSILLQGDKVDVRVSTLPTNYGESVVMRLLLSKVDSFAIKDLGLEEKNYQLLIEHISRPNGMIITTGPTGSGKTTTLYAILNQLNNSETKIITIEDPVEYEVKGINQSQVEPARDYTFAKGLRSIVRQDPDIIMVGEMRDLETVDIALNAALTGHLVLSTLHTNDAAGAIPRFLAMGAKSYLLAPALNLIIAQRLVRKLCDKCKKEIILEATIKNKILEIMGNVVNKINFNLEQTKFYTAVGCAECNQLGYKGRIGIFEMFAMNKDIEQVILSNEVSEYKIRELAVNQGMLTLVQDGLLKAIKGLTSVEEVFRVVT
ncbi:MAG TPA: GspE/PulE family protein [bacterium]|nr:GspE/PulE family protein [bacterium]